MFFDWLGKWLTTIIVSCVVAFFAILLAVGVGIALVCCGCITCCCVAGAGVAANTESDRLVQRQVIYVQQGAPPQTQLYPNVYPNANVNSGYSV
jgi:hypothetical protein